MIAVDAMGGDFAPHAVVHGAYSAAKKGIHVCLFGDEAIILSILIAHDSQWDILPIEIVHCTQIIDMADEPTRMVMRKKDASLVRAAHAVADGKAQALVSAGNSGAVLVAATLLVGRIEGVHRPAVGGILPTKKDGIFCLDLGANTDCKPEFLEQFALMGSTYMRMVRGIAQPRVALLSNGHEPYKGSQLVKKAYERLMALPVNFIGNLEPRDLFDDKADVLVCDGFAGNVLLKTIQGTAHVFGSWLKQEAERSWVQKVLLGLSSRVLQVIKRKTDYARAGGAPLLGVQKPVFLAHGCSHAGAIEQAISLAHATVKNKFVSRFNEQLQQVLIKSGTASSVFVPSSTIKQAQL